MIQCEVVLDKNEVNAWLRENGLRPAHASQPMTAGLLERSDVKAALLGEHAEGIANVILVVPGPGSPQAFRVSLALLENICTAMRMEVGSDERLTDEPG